MRKDDVLDYFGNNGAELAKKLNITKAAVSYWGKIIPQGRAYQIQLMTNGVLKVDPALYPPKRYPNGRRRRHR